MFEQKHGDKDVSETKEEERGKTQARRIKEGDRMSEAKYKQGKQICSVAEFEKSERLYFRVKFGDKFLTRHRGFLISWQYRTLKNFINRGWVFEAIQFPTGHDVIYCGEFAEAVLVAKKLEDEGYVMTDTRESPYVWLVRVFNGQNGMNFHLHEDKTVTWCDGVCLFLADALNEIPAKTFLGW